MSEMCFDDFNYDIKVCDKCGQQYDIYEGCDCESTDNENCQVDLQVMQSLPSQNDLLAEIIKLREYTAKHINIFGDSPIERIYDKLFELEQRFSKQTA